MVPHSRDEIKRESVDDVTKFAKISNSRDPIMYRYSKTSAYAVQSVIHLDLF